MQTKKVPIKKHRERESQDVICSFRISFINGVLTLEFNFNDACVKEPKDCQQAEEEEEENSHVQLAQGHLQHSPSMKNNFKE